MGDPMKQVRHASEPACIAGALRRFVAASLRCFSSPCLRVSVVSLFCVTAASAQDLIHKAPPQEMPFAIVNATVHTGDGQTFQSGFVLVREGRIVELGQGERLFTADTILIDGQGKHVYPALISASTSLGLTEIGAVRATRDQSEVGQFTPEVRATVAVNPDSTLIPVARAGGVLIAGVFPSGGRIPGRAGAIRLDGWTWEDMTIDGAVGLVVNFPQVRPSQDWWMTRSQSEQRERIDDNLAELAAFFDRLDAYAQAKGAGEAIPVDLGLEAAMMVLPAQDKSQDQKPVFVAANDMDQIASAITFFTERGMNPVITGGRDAPLVSALLKAHDVPVIVSSVYAFPDRADKPHDDAFTLPARLDAAGIRWCLASGGGASNERNLSHQIAKAVAFGLDPDSAIRAMTLSAAEILAIDDNYGSLEPGKSGTLILTDGDILEITTNVERAYIDGRELDLTNKHTLLRDKYLEKYRQLGEIDD